MAKPKCLERKSFPKENIRCGAAKSERETSVLHNMSCSDLEFRRVARERTP